MAAVGRRGTSPARAGPATRRSPTSRRSTRPPAGPAPSASGLLGVQACMWTEHVHDRPTLERLLFPRLTAIADAAWPGPDPFSAERRRARCNTAPERGAEPRSGRSVIGASAGGRTVAPHEGQASGHGARCGRQGGRRQRQRGRRLPAVADAGVGVPLPVGRRRGAALPRRRVAAADRPLLPAGRRVPVRVLRRPAGRPSRGVAARATSRARSPSSRPTCPGSPATWSPTRRACTRRPRSTSRSCSRARSGSSSTTA